MSKVFLFLILSSFSMGIFSTESREQEFWNWFSTNEKAIFTFENDQEKVLDTISDNLSKYREGLVFEISQISDGISADGISELFPDVEALSQAAPNFDRWVIIPFRPRMNDYAKFNLEYSGKDLDPSKIWIYSRIEEGYFDLIVYHPEYSEEEREIFVSASYILLDMALGEFYVVRGIRYIDHQRVPENPIEIGLKPFSELRAIFDAYKNGRKNG
ncbi:hypothetical protein [Gynuella sunshinyii]|nr:hypothetical protein [Gynuella sunshinyii]